MTVEKRLQYAFDVAEKEFGVDSLLDPTGLIAYIFLRPEKA